MRILLIETAADGLLDLALRAQQWGHSVRYCCAGFDPIRCPVGRGLVQRVGDWREHMRWCDLAIFGGNGKWLAEIDRWRELGVPIIGGSEKAAKLELDRLAGMAELKRAGIEVPPYKQFARLDEAMAYVAKRDEGFAVKPCGDVADKSLSFVAKTGAEMLWRLDSWKREGKRFPSGFIVQDRVEGVEFAVGAWVTDNGFAEGFEENWEEKKLHAGRLGPNCGEAGTVMRLVKSSKLAKQVLAPFEDWLVSSGYRGNVDVNCIVDDQGTAWPLEWTVRLGWPAFNIELSLHDGDPIEFLAGVASGKAPASRQMDTIAVGVVMALPPYPFGHERPEEVVGVPIWGAEHDDVHFTMAAQGSVPNIESGTASKEQGIVTAGSYVLTAAGLGDTVQAARRLVYRRLDRIEIPANPFYRNDIGSRLTRDLGRLQQFGYARDMSYA